MTMLTKVGYGQVEPNHLSAQRTGQIYAQTPAKSDITVLENGSFLKLDAANDVVGIVGNGEWMLVYNEVKLYENHKQGYKDFAILKDESVGGIIVPRLLKTNIGDRFTTNLIDTTVEGTVAVGDIFEVAAGTAPYDKVGVLTQVASVTSGNMTFQVLKVYTMADGQTAVKVVRVA